MSGFDGDVSIPRWDKRIPVRIQRAIESGMKEAGTELGRKGRMVAQNRIQQRGYIWTGELMESFKTTNERTGDGRSVVIINYADHAAASEEGAEYTDRGPPIAALLPWVMSKYGGAAPPSGGPGGDSGDNSTSGGGGGTLKTDPDSKLDGDWTTINSGKIFQGQIFTGQKVRVYHKPSDETLDGVVEEKHVIELFVDLNDGTSINIPWDNTGDYRLLAVEKWSNLATVDQLAFIDNAFGRITLTGVDPDPVFPDWDYFDLPDVDVQAIEDHFKKISKNSDFTEGYMMAADRTSQIGGLPPEDKNGNTMALGHVNGSSYNPSEHTRKLGFRAFVSDGTVRANIDDHLDTYSHEWKHALLQTMGVNYHPNKQHDDLLTYYRGSYLDWELNADGTSNSPTHNDPVLFALHNERKYPIEGGHPLDDPDGWDKTVREVPDYLDNLASTGEEIDFPIASRYLNPDDPQVRVGDEFDVKPEDSFHHVTYRILDTEPVEMGDGWGYKADVDGTQDFLEVDSDGKLLSGDAEFLFRPNKTEIDTDLSPGNTQKYLETDMNDDPFGAYIESVNRALYTHIWARNQESGTGETEKSDNTVLDDGYGMTNAQETAAVLHAIMLTEVSEPSAPVYRADNLERIVNTHPYLVSAWLNLFGNPSDVAAGELDRLGVTY